MPIHPAYASPEAQQAIRDVQRALDPWRPWADKFALQMHGRDKNQAFEELAEASQVLFAGMIQNDPTLSPTVANGLTIAFCEMVRERLYELDQAPTKQGRPA